MNRLLTIVFAALTLNGVSAHADTVLGIYAGVGTWQQNYGGEFASGGAAIDVEDDLGFDDDTTNFFYVALEHPIPQLPNVRVQYSELDLNQTATLTGDIDFNGISFPAGTDVGTIVDVRQIDTALYYEFLDNVVSLDLGIAVRYLDGEIAISSAVDSSPVEFQGVLPLLYGKARVDLPLSGFWVGAEISGAEFDGNSLIDGHLVLGWESPYRIGIEAGWRSYRLKLDDFDDVDSADLDVSGPFAAINVHF